MRNLSTNLENPGKSCPVVAPQKTDTSKSCNCLFKKLTKWCNSDQDGSLIPQCLKKIKKKNLNFSKSCDVYDFI